MDDQRHLESNEDNSSIPSTNNVDFILKHELSTEEKRLASLLIDRVLPPFAKSIRLQALVVYQADQQKMNSLLINKAFERTLDGCLIEQDEPNLSNFSTSSVTENYLTSDLSIKLTDTHDYEAFSPIQCGSRRKRKLSRPCKIPQTASVSNSNLHTPNDDDCMVETGINTSIPYSVFNSYTMPTSLNTIAIKDSVKPNTANSLFLPVSAVTLFPHVSVFSLPVTVLSTVPRPILPRICPEKSQPTRPPPFQSQPLTSPIRELNLGTKPKSAKESAIINTVPLGPTKSTDSINSNDSGEMLNRRYAKSFVCNQCRKVFTSLSCLCEHTFEVHKAFRCTICGAQFTQRSNLQRHSLRHVGFKPFLCKLCDRAYYRKDHLVRHIELAHPGSDPRANLTVKLSSAECLDYLDQMNGRNGVNTDHTDDDDADNQQQDESVTVNFESIENNGDCDDHPYHDSDTLMDECKMQHDTTSDDIVKVECLASSSPPPATTTVTQCCTTVSIDL